jgi:ubiquinone/menaquinone biosynthesis C-methylase UbiE
MTGPTHDLGLGAPIDLGASGVQKRLGAFARHWPLHGRHLLDIGCGNGAYTEVLAASYDHVDAVDVSQEQVDSFRARIGSQPVLSKKISIQSMSAESLTFEDGTFDAVTCIEVLEHVRSPVETCREAFRVLRPGGAFLVTVPNRAFPFETHLVKIGKHSFPGRRLPGLPYLPFLHSRIADARIYTVRTLRTLITGAGFDEIATDFVMPPFDRSSLGRRYVKPLTERLEKSPVRRMGVSIVGVYQKPPATAA